MPGLSQEASQEGELCIGDGGEMYERCGKGLERRLLGILREQPLMLAWKKLAPWLWKFVGMILNRMCKFWSLTSVALLVNSNTPINAQ